MVLSQTLYPRILRRVQCGCNNADFSITFREDNNRLQCFVCFLADDVIREVCVLWEEPSPGFCDAKIMCLSRVLAILPADRSPVAIRGCSSSLFDVFSNWCKIGGRPMPLPVLENTSDVFKEHVLEAGLVGANLPEFRGCVRQGQFPFASLCTVISE